MIKSCAFDGCSSSGSKICGRCKTARYCSLEHQQQCWAFHKPQCHPISSTSSTKPKETASAFENDISLEGLKTPLLQRSFSEPPPFLLALHTQAASLPLPFSPALLDSLAVELSSVARETYGSRRFVRSKSEPMTPTDTKLFAQSHVTANITSDQKTAESKEVKSELQIQVCSVCYDPVLQGKNPVLCGNVDCQQVCSSCLKMMFEEKVKSSRGSAPIMRCPGPGCIAYLPFTRWTTFVSLEITANYVKNAEDMLTLQCAYCHQRGTLLKQDQLADTQRGKVREKFETSSPEILRLIDAYCRFEIEAKTLLENECLSPFAPRENIIKQELKRILDELEDCRQKYILAMNEDKDLKILSALLSEQGKRAAVIRRHISKGKSTLESNLVISSSSPLIDTPLSTSASSTHLENTISDSKENSSSTLLPVDNVEVEEKMSPSRVLAAYTRNLDSLPFDALSTLLAEEEKILVSLKKQHRESCERIKAAFPFGEKTVRKAELKKTLRELGRSPSPLHSLIGDMLILIVDVERKAALYLRFCLMFPQVRSLCCSRLHCFKCKVVGHDGLCSSNVSDVVKRCPKCNIGLVRGDGCDSITCICGHRFSWSCV